MKAIDQFGDGSLYLLDSPGVSLDYFSHYVFDAHRDELDSISQDT